MACKKVKLSAAFLSLSFLIFPVSRTPAFAEMSGMQGGQSHADHVHQGLIKEKDVVAGLRTEPADINAGIPASLLISISDPQGKPIQGLSLMHERYLHVVIASADFSVFSHIHPDDFEKLTPEVIKGASFSLRYTFPKAGRYIIGADFAVRDQPFSRHFLVNVTGRPEMGSSRTDLSREKRFGNYDVTLSSGPKIITAGKEVMLRYRIKMNGAPVKDLEPYLAAPMHLSIISADLGQFIHTHGEVPGMSSMGHGHMHMTVPEKFGPEIEVRTVFPQKGLYQVFGEFRHRGRIIATSFMLDVE